MENQDHLTQTSYERDNGTIIPPITPKLGKEVPDYEAHIKDYLAYIDEIWALAGGYRADVNVPMSDLLTQCYFHIIDQISAWTMGENPHALAEEIDLALEEFDTPNEKLRYLKRRVYHELHKRGVLLYEYFEPEEDAVSKEILADLWEQYRVRMKGGGKDADVDG